MIMMIINIVVGCVTTLRAFEYCTHSGQKERILSSRTDPDDDVVDVTLFSALDFF
jgi:hypothetical protein